MKHDPHARPGQAYPAFSLPLQRHYYRAGRDCCMAMGEDQPMIVYMREAITKLIAGLDSPDSTAEAVRYWSKGFESALFERLNHWQGRQAEFLALLDGHERVNLAVRTPNPITGTLHCRRDNRQYHTGLHSKSGPRKAPRKTVCPCAHNPFPSAADIDDDPEGSKS